MLTKYGFIIREIRKQVVMIVLMRLYEGKGSSNWSNRSNSEKSRRSRQPLGNENKSCKSDKRNSGLEDLRVKRSKAVE
ncbi:hypothetical protein TNCV_4152421 [Trichonephila clavipes]|nr:hypothetical protein TNCV_4152421 [Trichonephila clavipes]